MKRNMIILLAVMTLGGVACGGRMNAVAEQPKTVHAYDPQMNNMEMITMEQKPGWALLAGTQWTGNSYTTTVRGVNDDLNASFINDGARSYHQSPLAKSGTFDGNNIYLDLMSAPDYLDYVFHRQFPNLKNAKRTLLKTTDQYSEAERQQLEQLRQLVHNSVVQFTRQSALASTANVIKTTAEFAAAEYKWVNNGDTIVHGMQVVLTATYTNYYDAYSGRTTTAIAWQQYSLRTITFPAKNEKKVEDDVKQMLPTLKFNDTYIAMLNNKVQQGIQRSQSEVRRIQGEMAQSAIRHQQEMARMIQETNEYIAKKQRETMENRQAMMEKVNRDWRDAIVGVNRYVGVDGKAVIVPVSAGSKVWQSADGGTIYSSDSYLFNPVDRLYDKDGYLQDFRQLQLMK